MLNIFQLILRGLIIIGLLDLAIAKDFNSVKTTKQNPKDRENFVQNLDFLYLQGVVNRNLVK